MRAEEPDLDILFVGGGFRTTSFLASAPWLLGTRLGIVERRPSLGGGDYHDYGILSTSVGARFLKDVDLAGDWPELWRSPVVREVATAEGPVDLRELAAALDRIGQAVTSALPDGAVLSGRHASEVEIGGSHPSVSLTSGETLRARHVVLATGRREPPHPALAPWPDTTLLSGRVLDPRTRPRILELVRARPGAPIVVAGSSHSAMSALRVLLDMRAADPRTFAGHRIEVLERSPARLFYGSLEEARRSQVPEREILATPEAVCGVTGAVFRDTGLRHESKLLYTRLWDGAVPDVQLVRDTDVEHEADRLGEAALIVQALGYVGRAPVLTMRGQGVLRAADSRRRVDADVRGRLLVEGRRRDDVTALRLDPTPPGHRDNAQYGQDLYAHLSDRLRGLLDPARAGTS
ncbi:MULTISPECIES: hypothetical protein [Clavibacter]|uniref:Uncharacterized protein n=1 Tax=Clavibacter tessellarius TaxID=31965 RepID=A0A154V559_9MICO|nr:MULTISPECIES: hypothetical protein [Clavibacter]KZC96516.1 hypothetical protein AWH51_02115 [Clavibacter michiganensis subsp. tessellarius]MDA3804100.1 hypothetical protein [Clavibacter sp. CT19]